jgi:serine/threonine protein kinase
MNVHSNKEVPAQSSVRASLSCDPGDLSASTRDTPERYDRKTDVAEKDPDNAPRGRLRALYDWVRGTPASAGPSQEIAAVTPPPDGRSLPERIGHYAIEHKLGEGGMGVVYAARDERLERTVALKTMSALAKDDTGRRRFWREARAAAAVNHPNVCQLYEIGEDGGELFIAMELLEGEPLSERLRRGALSVAEAAPIGWACWPRCPPCTRAASCTGTSSLRTCS